MSAAAAPRIDALARWSAAARCPRWAALGALGHEPEPPDDQIRRYFLRGKQIGAYVVEQLRDKYGPLDVLAEKSVAWACGTGHPDAFIVSESLTVEVKSRMQLEPSPEDILQLAGYMHFDQESQRGALILVNPSDLSERAVRVRLTKKLRATVEERVDQVATAVKTGGQVLPDCVSSSPAQCRRSMMCPFAAVAWPDWTPLDPKRLDGEVAMLVGQLYFADRQVRSARAEAELHEQERSEIRARLLELGIEPGVQYETGPLRMRCIEVAGRETFDIRTAVAAGGLEEAEVEPWRRVGRPHHRWYIDRVGDAPVIAEDYGEEPPF